MFSLTCTKLSLAVLFIASAFYYRENFSDLYLTCTKLEKCELTNPENRDYRVYYGLEKCVRHAQR
jgi:hypothetical protein